MTLVPWAVGKQLLWDVTVVDSLAPCRINGGSVCNPGTAVAGAEERKNDNYKDLANDGYLFQPLAFEIQGAAGPSTRHFGFGFGFSGIGSGFRVLRQISGFGSGFGFNKFSGSGSGSGIHLCRISKTRLLFAVFGFDKNFQIFLLFEVFYFFNFYFYFISERDCIVR